MNENNVVEIYQDNTPSKIAFIRNAWWSNNDFLICESGMFKRSYPDRRKKTSIENSSGNVPEWTQVHSLPVFPVSINNPHYDPFEKGVYNNIKSGFVEIKFKSALGLEWKNQFISYEQYQNICNSVLKKTWMVTGFDERTIQRMLNQCFLDGQSGYVNALGEQMPSFLSVQKIFNKSGYSDDFIEDAQGNIKPTKVFLRKGDAKFLVPDDSQILSVAAGDINEELRVKREILECSPFNQCLTMMCLSGYARGAAINMNFNPYILVHGVASKGKSRAIETIVSNECKPSISVGNVVQAIDATLPGIESNLLDFNHGPYVIDEADELFNKKPSEVLLLLNGGGNKKRDTKSENSDAIFSRTYHNNFLMFGNAPFSKIYSDADQKKVPVLTRGIELDIDDEVIHRPIVSPMKYSDWNETLFSNYGHVRFLATEYVVENADFLKKLYNNFIFKSCDHEKELKKVVLEGFEDIAKYNFSFLKKYDRTASVYACMYVGAYIIKHIYGEAIFSKCIDSLRTLFYSRSDEQNPSEIYSNADIDNYNALKSFVIDCGLNGQNMIWSGYAWDETCETFKGDMYKFHEHQKNIAKKITKTAREKNTSILGYVEITKPMLDGNDLVGNVMLTPAGQKRFKDYGIDLETLKISGEKLNNLYLGKYPDKNPEKAKDDKIKVSLINELFFVVKSVNMKTDKGKTLHQQLASSYTDSFSANKNRTAFFRLDDYNSIFFDPIEVKSAFESEVLENNNNIDAVKEVSPEVADFFADLDSEDFEDFMNNKFSSLS